jgi:hypothetical protein
MTHEPDGKDVPGAGIADVGSFYYLSSFLRSGSILLDSLPPISNKILCWKDVRRFDSFPRCG